MTVEKDNSNNNNRTTFAITVDKRKHIDDNIGARRKRETTTATMYNYIILERNLVSSVQDETLPSARLFRRGHANLMQVGIGFGRDYGRQMKSYWHT